MTQAVATTSDTPPTSWRDAIAHRVGEYLSDSQIEQITKVAKIALAIIISNCAVAYLSPYIILDATTTRLGIACAVAINAVAIPCFHALIKKLWERHWVSNYEIPVPPSTPPQTQSTEASAQTTLQPSQAEFNYNEACEALNRAIKKVKAATKDRDLFDKGEIAKVEARATDFREKKKELSRYATTKKKLIEQLAQTLTEFEPYREKAKEFENKLEEIRRASDPARELEDDKKIIEINAHEIATAIVKTFNEKIQELNDSGSIFGERYTNHISADDFSKKLEKYKNQLKLLNTRLIMEQKDLTATEATIELVTNARAEDKKKVYQITESSDSRKPSQLETAKHLSDTAQKNLKAKMEEKNTFLKKIQALKTCSIRNPEDKLLADMCLDYSTIKELNQYRENLESRPKNDDEATTLILKNLLNDNVLLEFELSLQENINAEIISLYDWENKFYEQFDNVQDSMNGLEKSFVSQWWTTYIRGKKNLSTEEISECKIYFTKLLNVLDNLRISCSALTCKYTIKKHQENLRDFPLISQTKAWENLLNAQKLKFFDPENQTNEPNAPEETLKLFFGNLLNLTSQEIDELIAEYSSLAFKHIQQKIFHINTFKEITKEITNLKEGKIAPSDLARLIQLNSNTLWNFRLNPELAMIKIRDSEQEIFNLKKKRKNEDELLQKIPLLINAKNKALEKLKEEQTHFENQCIKPLKEEAKNKTREYISLKVDKKNLDKRIKENDEELKGLQTKKEQLATTLQTTENKEEQFKKIIALLEVVKTLLRVMEPVNKILMESEQITQTALTECYEAEQLWISADKTRQSRIIECTQTLTDAIENQRIEAEKKQAAFDAFTKEKEEQSTIQINSLRVTQHKNVISLSRKTRNFYESKLQQMDLKNEVPQGNEKPEFDKANLQILEKKNHLAVKLIESKPDNANLNRLHLQKHRLIRYQAEKKWKSSYKTERTLPKTDFIKELRSEQYHVLRYYSSRLAREQNNADNQTIKANLALKTNLVMLNLILDMIRTEVSCLNYLERKAYNLNKTLQNYLEELLGANPSKELDKPLYEAIHEFNIAAYGKPSIADEKQGVLNSVKGFLVTQESLKKPFFPRLIDKLVLDETSTASLRKLTNFIEAISTASIELLPQKDRGSFKDAPIARLIGNKINLIQESLNKPFSEDPQFVDQYSVYLETKKKYKQNKYQNKKESADILEQSTKDKHEKSTNKLYDKAKTLLEMEETRRITEQNRRNTEIRAREEAVRTRDQAIASRSTAMETYSSIETLTYAIPTIVLWAFYSFSPILSSISLSLRVSQNILWISSATNLFVQSRFPSFHNPELNLSPSIAPERVSPI